MYVFRSVLHLSSLEKFNSNAAKIIGKLWDAETNEVKKIFKVSTSFSFEESLSIDMQDIAFYQAKELLREHPNYKYNPRKTSEMLTRAGVARSRARRDLLSEQIFHLIC